MSNMQTNRFIPDYLIAPGEVLEDYLDDLGMTQAELADRTGLTKKTINEIIKAKTPITPETALRLEIVLGRPAHFWSNLERQYQDDRVRLAEHQRLESDLEWLKRVPVKDMVKMGWIAYFKKPVEQLAEVLRYYGVASPNQWATIWREYQVAYRQSRRFEACAEAVSAWLRQGEIRAQKEKCAPYDRNRFQSILDEIRYLTCDKPEVFQPRLKELCASTGVAVVFVRELPKTGVHGATRWLGDKAVIQLSLRYKSNDHLWFTFFHEAGHILKHGRKEVFLEGKGLDDEKEKEADAYARDKLIPLTHMSNFLKGKNFSYSDVKLFAEKIDVAPGIVLGRLQYDKFVPFQTRLNDLKVFYRWKNQRNG
jgi:HTH-type transcriptional regulator / antitoxin HigA